MNMKKTIAAIAAGAVAVSAMATTVSALQDTSLTYNLVAKKEIKKNDKNTATYEFTIQDATPKATNLSFIAANDTVKSVVIKVASSAAGDQNKIFTYSTAADALNYNAKILEDGTMTLDTEFLGYSDEATLTLTVTVNTETTYASWDDASLISLINKDITGYTPAVEDDPATTDVDETAAAKGIGVETDNGTATPVVLKAAKHGGEKKTEYFIPFKTAIKNNQNVTAYLQNTQGYHNVGAVLNDAIENYESVTFTFNTATNGIVWTPAEGADSFEKFYGTDQWGGAGYYETGLASVGGYADKLVGVYSAEWWADSSYKSFDQHLYQGTTGLYGSYSDGTSYASENSGYLGFDWTGYNLFQGALIINENLTMSLAETDYFDWTATSLSFDWDAIMDGAMTSNDYAVYLHSMKLATSNTWYWDNMVVTLTAGAAEDGVDAEAGVEADDEELAEEEVEEEVVEEEVEEEVEVEVANPTTGNASVALAVIPVALAAAAVVAKKRS